MSRLIAPKSVPAYAVTAALESCELLVSREVLLELEAVLRRPKFERLLALHPWPNIPILTPARFLARSTPSQP